MAAADVRLRQVRRHNHYVGESEHGNAIFRKLYHIQITVAFALFIRFELNDLPLQGGNLLTAAQRIHEAGQS